MFLFAYQTQEQRIKRGTERYEVFIFVAIKLCNQLLMEKWLENSLNRFTKSTKMTFPPKSKNAKQKHINISIFDFRLCKYIRGCYVLIQYIRH